MKELEDQDWFPSLLRNFQTDFIGFVVTRFPVYRSFEEYLRQAQRQAVKMHDLCSGSGEAALQVFKNTSCFTGLTLSDKFPNAAPGKTAEFVFENARVDVLHTEFESGTCYTMFNALHHFPDRDKLKIVERIKASGASAFFAEVLEPRPGSFLKVLLLSTFGVLLFSPFVRPRSLKRLFFTYLVPVNLFTIAFDGIVSVFKSRTVRHYRKLFQSHEGIDVFRLENGLSPLVVIHIHPA